jgi:type I restriction enzyme, R subunit
MTTNKITESSIEQYALDLLVKQGYQYIYGPDTAPDSEAPLLSGEAGVRSTKRQSFEDVILYDVLKKAVQRINPTLAADVRDDAIKQILRLNSPELISNNESFHRMLTEGIKVTYQKDGNSRGDLVNLIDFTEPDNNEFLVVNQFTVVESKGESSFARINKRPDLILFINGLPLVVIELKNAVDENTTIDSAYSQLQTYKQDIPTLFTYNGFMIISDGLEARAGTISSDMSRFLAWKSSDGKDEASHLIGQLETLIKGMLNKTTLLDLIRHFIVFEESVKTQSFASQQETGLTFIQTVKKIAAYHQYYAVNRAVDSTLRASGFVVVVRVGANNHSPLRRGFPIKESPESYGVKGVSKQPSGDRKGGVVWHTQGSGKSLSMVFYTGKIVLAMNNPTIVVITDRNDLDDQLYETFVSSKQLLRQEPVQAANRDHLKELLKVASGGIVFTTIQKFQPDEGNVYEQLSDRENIIVIADEAHRTQYGFKAKLIDDKDENGKVIGKKIVYGFAKYMRDALPNATYLGFTGTPIESTDVNTPAVFGNYVDVYDISQAVIDGATVRIY